MGFNCSIIPNHVNIVLAIKAFIINSDYSRIQDCIFAVNKCKKSNKFIASFPSNRLQSNTSLFRLGTYYIYICT